MKICAISDMHGQLDIEIEKCDILCICGDIVPLNVQTSFNGTMDWIKNVFIPWCNSIECDKIFLISGNHDIVSQNFPEEWGHAFEGTKIEYLLDSSSEYTDEKGKTITIYGTPWCHQFFNWAFMTSDEKLAEIFEKIPENVDLLMTHDSPYGTSDVLLQNVAWNSGNHIGCKPLADAVNKKKPKILIHGHLHSTNHECEMMGETEVYNVSVLNENYTLVYEPKYIDF